MNRGVLLLAENNEEINYVELAITSAFLAKRQLNIPVALLVDAVSLKSVDENKLKIFDEIIVIPPSTLKQTHVYTSHNTRVKLSYNNENRINVYDYTPFNETLIIDADYLMYDDSLNLIWDTENILISSNARNVINTNLGIYDRKLFDKGIKLRWATVFYFRKGAMAKCFFDLVKEIKENYFYYTTIYQTRYKYYKNDYSFSIASHMLNNFNDSGYAVQELPIEILLSMSRDMIFKVTENYILLSSKNILAKVNCNVHILNKIDLLPCAREFNVI